MANTTQTYWDINGVPLNTYAFNISTLGGGRTNVPTLRGTDVVIPYRRGELFVPKTADSRDITLSMWVNGMDEDGNPPADGNIEGQWQENLDKLRNLMWSEDGELTLTKRFWRGGSVVEASAQVQFSRGLDPTMETVGLARMTVTFHLADPFFYGEEVVEEFSEETKILSILGDVPTYYIELDMEAGVEMVNQSSSPNLSVSTSVSATLDVRNRKVNNISSPALVTHSGSNNWFALFPGDNTIVCNNGDATLTYRPAYF